MSKFGLQVIGFDEWVVMICFSFVRPFLVGRKDFSVLHSHVLIRGEEVHLRRYSSLISGHELFYQEQVDRCPLPQFVQSECLALCTHD